MGLVDRLLSALRSRLRRTQSDSPDPTARTSKISAESLRHRFEHLEWEPLRHELEFHVDHFDGQDGHFGTAKVRRDETFNLCVNIVCSNGAWPNGTIRGTPGLLESGFELSGRENEDRGIRLLKSHIIERSNTLTPSGSKTELGVLTSRVTLERSQDASAVLLVDWFISGIKGPFHRRTERNAYELWTRTRKGIDHDEHAIETSFPPANFPQSIALDYFVISLPTQSVRVCKVSKKLCPEWAHPLALEFDLESGEPSQAERDTIIEAMGFLFGRHLLRIGTSVFNTHGIELRSEAISPWGHPSRQDIDGPEYPVFHGTSEPRAEKILSSLISAFVDKAESLELSYAVWTMWFAQGMPVGFATPLYSSALETIMNAWSDAQQPKLPGTYMEAKAFKKIFAPAIEEFRRIANDKDAGVTNSEKIVGRVTNTVNQMSTHHRMEVFLSSIGLPVGAGEAAVMGSRHRAAHGAKSTQSPQDLLLLQGGYRTILNRVILKLLGHSGTYTDYSVVGHPERALDEPIGYKPPSKPAL